ncbi:unnamed protein product [Caenorhabditis nigoni]
MCANPPAEQKQISNKMALPEAYKISGSVTNWKEGKTSLLQETATKEFRVLEIQEHNPLQPVRLNPELSPNTTHKALEKAKKDIDIMSRRLDDSLKLYETDADGNKTIDDELRRGCDHYVMIAVHQLYGAANTLEAVTVPLGPPDDVFSAHKSGIRDAKIIMNFFGDIEFKFKAEKSFLEHCDQFISYGWNELLKMFPELREPEDPKEMGRRVVTLKCDEATQVARSQTPIVFHRSGGECDICGKLLTDGLELVEVWSRRILLYMLFKAKTIKRDRCKRIYNTTEQLVVCREHAKQAIEQVFETFGTQHPSQFLSMFQAPMYKPIINRMYEDLCRVYDLWYENRDTLIRAARRFVLSCEKDPATEVPTQNNCLKTPTYSTRARQTQH